MFYGIDVAVAIHTKYPRTFHLPHSPGATNDDKTLESDIIFSGQEVIVTLKMDGENTTLYSDGLHARSLIMDNHVSRDWVKSFHSQIKADIPANWRICGENLYAQHSIAYNDLTSYFQVFSIWEDDTCLDWDTTEAYCALMELTPVHVIYRGLYSKVLIDKVFSTYVGQEGYVVRLRQAFEFKDFSTSVAKYVRANHVQTDEHWKTKQVVPNKVKDK